MKKNKTNLILIISIILFLISMATPIYFLNVIKNKNKHISTVSATLDEKIIEKNNINTLEKKMSELGDMENKLGSHFVDPSTIDAFVGYLENLGTSNNLNLSVKSVEVPKGVKNKILVNINMSGDFSDIIKTIDLLENAPYKITITSSYVNKDITPDIAQTGGVVNNGNGTVLPVSNESSWQADITFSVLSL